MLWLRPKLLTWPGTSPRQHNAASTGGLFAHTWTPARSWGLGPSQGDLKGAVEEAGKAWEAQDVSANIQGSPPMLLGEGIPGSELRSEESGRKSLGWGLLRQGGLWRAEEGKCSWQGDGMA